VSASTQFRAAKLSHAQVVSALDQADRTVLTVKDTNAIGAGTRFLRVRVVQE
jgi:hypothetical protein